MANMWGSLFTILMINIVLSGDNALMIALATRRLKIEQRKKAIFWGILGAVTLQILSVFVVVHLLELPYFQSIGGMLLGVIAIKLLVIEENSTEQASPSNLLQAIKIIIAIDFLTSLDNVLGIAGIANGNLYLLISGLLISIPLLIFGSSLIQRVLQRYPFTVYLGAGLLGWTGGDMILKDPAFHSLLAADFLKHIFPTITAITVIMIGLVLREQKLPTKAIKS